MSSVVVELQRDALDRVVKVSDLLRKALVVARKLNLGEFQKWVEEELRGYMDAPDAPKYREVHGEVKLWNPYRGWIPVVFEDPRAADMYSKRACGVPIAELEEVRESKRDDSTLAMPLPADAQARLSQKFGMPTQVVLFVPRGSFIAILDAVRTIVLNWALKLEEEGILGEGLSFSREEQEAAARGPQNVNNFYGPVQSPQIQQGGNQPVQISVSVDLDPKAIESFIAALRANLSSLDLSRDQRQEAEAELRTVEAQISSPKPKPSIVAESLRSIRSILEGAAGSAAGQLLIELGKLLA